MEEKMWLESAGKEKDEATKGNKSLLSFHQRSHCL